MRSKDAASRPIRGYPDTNQPPTGQRAATAVLDWCVFLWRCVRVLLGGFVLGFLGHLFGVAIGVAGYPTLAAAFLLAWTATLGVGLVLWIARGPRC